MLFDSGKKNYLILNNIVSSTVTTKNNMKYNFDNV